MDITKSTMWGSIALLCMLVAVFVGHQAMLAQRSVCGRELDALIPKLDAYAAQHHGQLPATAAELGKALGSLPTSTINGHMPYAMAEKPLKWKSGAKEPYLWDPIPHPILQGVHVLYTDGTVHLEDNLVEQGHKHLPLPR